MSSVISPGRSKSIQLVNTGGLLVKYLAEEDSICPFLGSEVKFIKKLGAGSYGEAFSVKLTDDEGVRREYVAKILPTKIDAVDVVEEVKLEETAKALEKEMFLNYETTITLNGKDPNRILKIGDKVYIPYFAEFCRIDENVKVVRLDGKGEIDIPGGSYLCSKDRYSEYVIGILAGNLFRKNISANFFDVHGFATCGRKSSSNKPAVNQIIFMEKISGSMRDIASLVYENFKDPAKMFIRTIPIVLYIQIAHAIACLQYNYSIVHGDLHDDNIFIEQITEDTIYNGETLFDADYFHYKVGSKDLYLPKIPYLVKIGDFGFAFKWKSPMIGNKGVIGGDFGDQIPNWFSKNYDLLYITKIMYEHNKSNIFFKNVMAWCLNSNLSNMNNILPVYFSARHRPRIKRLEREPLQKVSPLRLLFNQDLMSAFITKPTSGKIVTLGTIG